ncbi:MAG: hypothetical protein HQL76_06000 [Magnetococcales bacterium]|nr:hypothetical protein [Magnetococcales bacterium]
MATEYLPTIPEAEGYGSIIVGLGAWRLTQGIYQIDPEVMGALMSTPTGNLPVDLLYRLPEWCMYIEIPDHPTLGKDLHGVYVYLEWDTHTGGAELRLLLDREDSLTPAVMHLIPGADLAACLQAATDRAIANALRYGMSVGWSSDEIRAVWDPIIPVILYLCSEEPDIISRASIGLPRHPSPVKTKKGMRLFPPDQPKIWEVGTKIGEALRSASPHGEPKGGSHAQPKAHIRRAHWHTYWVGREGTEGRRRILKWVHPMLVGRR